MDILMEPDTLTQPDIAGNKIIRRHGTGRLPIPGSFNVRDFGGIPILNGDTTITPGILIRGESPSIIGEEGVYDLISRGVTMFIDLRGKQESEKEGYDILEPYLKKKAITRHTVELVPSDAWRSTPHGQDPYSHLTEAYTECLKNGLPELLTILNDAARHDDTVYLHCAAGKDRTGIAAAILLTALEANRDDIVNDYMETTVGFPHIVEKLQHSASYPEFLHPDWEKIMPRETVIIDLLDYVDTLGGVEEMLYNAGMTPSDLLALTAWLTS